MRGNCQRPARFPNAEHLEAIIELTDHAKFNQTLPGNPIFTEFGKLLQMHNCVAFAKNVSKAALRKTALQGHLAAFKAALKVITGTRLLPFMPFTGGLAVAGTHAAPESLRGVLLSRSGPQR